MPPGYVALDVSQSGYDAWKDRPDAPRTLRRIWLAGEIADATSARSMSGTQTAGVVLNALGIATQRWPERAGLVIHF